MNRMIFNLAVGAVVAVLAAVAALVREWLAR